MPDGARRLRRRNDRFGFSAVRLGLRADLDHGTLDAIDSLDAVNPIDPVDSLDAIDTVEPYDTIEPIGSGDAVHTRAGECRERAGRRVAHGREFQVHHGVGIERRDDGSEPG
jgi:hypothetical protein